MFESLLTKLKVTARRQREALNVTEHQIAEIEAAMRDKNQTQLLDSKKK